MNDLVYGLILVRLKDNRTRVEQHYGGEIENSFILNEAELKRFLNHSKPLKAIIPYAEIANIY